MKIIRTFDSQFVHACLTHARIWPHVRDDGSPEAELYFPPMSDVVYWLEAVEGDKRLGVFMAHPQNSICYEAHVALLPVAWGRSAEIARRAITWMFSNTPCRRIVVNVPEHNILALRMANKVGLEYIGSNIASIIQNGILQDQFIFGVSKGEA